jgi:hypothetical protein
MRPERRIPRLKPPTRGLTFMFRALVDRRPERDCPQPIALLFDSHPHVAGFEAAALQLRRAAGLHHIRSLRASQGNGQRSAGSEAYGEPYPLPRPYAGQETNGRAMKTKQTPAVPFSNNGGKP